MTNRVINSKIKLDMGERGDDLGSRVNNMTSEQMERFFNYAFGSDLDYYEEHLIYLPDEAQERLFRDNPEFMARYPVARDNFQLLKDKRFRDILRKFDVHEGVEG